MNADRNATQAPIAWIRCRCVQTDESSGRYHYDFHVGAAPPVSDAASWSPLYSWPLVNDAPHDGSVADWLDQEADRQARAQDGDGGVALGLAAAKLRRLGDPPMFIGTSPAPAVQVLIDVWSERRRQLAIGYGPQHDDAHDAGELAQAAACFAINAGSMLLGTEVEPFQADEPPICTWWPWSNEYWKPRDPRRDLVRAGALILAEIERLDRAARAGRAATVRQLEPGG